MDGFDMVRQNGIALIHDMRRIKWKGRKWSDGIGLRGQSLVQPIKWSAKHGERMNNIINAINNYHFR